MKSFMDNFKAARGGDIGLTKCIDTEVYTKDRGIRILGSCKRTDVTRKLVKVDWHAASRNAQDSEFYITNIGAEHMRVGLIKPVKESKGKIVVSRTGKIAKIPAEKGAKLSQSVVDAVQALFLKYKRANQLEFKYDGKGMLFRLQRVQGGHCDICNREHEADNAFLKLGTTGFASLHCYRVEVIRAVSPQAINVGTLLDADTTYSSRFVKHEYLAPPRSTPFRTNTFRKQLPSLVISSATGTGKTGFVRALVAANPGYKFVAVTCRRSLADALEPRLVFTNYQDIKEPRIACDKLVIQAETLYRIDHR
ncbi:hypothetical protein BGZ51_008582 [Haplosporangium sp. Z 767]|nr:hypothetical protein BGZ51_008582 [Haplosporangium sp. Z 767]